MTIVVSFLLIIPIEWVIWMFALPSGLLIGYYANQRSDRRAGPWGRILVNGLFAGFVTGLTAAVFVLRSRGCSSSPTTAIATRASVARSPAQVGADCVYQRYLRPGGARLRRRRCHGRRSFTALLLERAVR